MYSDDDMDSDLEDAYDLREVSSDVEMHPDDLLSDARYLALQLSMTLSKTGV